MSMIARHETHLDKIDIWSALAAPLPADEIQWRQDGRPAARDGKVFARFVAFIDAQFVHSRFDSVVPGEWDLTLELLPAAVTGEGEEVEPFSFKARLQVLGVIREDVGSGKDYKTASTDAFKRAAVRFGVGKELYAMNQNWVQMDGDGKFARPIEDPAVAYARRYGAARRESPVAPGPQLASRQDGGLASPASSAPTDSLRTTDEPSCPKCGGRTWNNKLTKRNPKAPDYKCRDRACDGVIWPEREDPRAVPNRPGDEPPHPADDEEIPY
jgi:hypothetical protein